MSWAVFPSQREAACAMFTEDLAELELSEREAVRKREEMDAAHQLEETYRVGSGHLYCREKGVVVPAPAIQPPIVYRQPIWMACKVQLCLRLC